MGFFLRRYAEGTTLLGSTLAKSFENRHVKQPPANYRILRHPASIRIEAAGRFCAGTDTDS